MKKLLVISAALIVLFALAPHGAHAQTNTLSYTGVPATVTPGQSFVFTVNLNFTAGDSTHEPDVAGISLWFYQMNPSVGPFTLAFTALSRSGSVMDIAQTSNNDLFGQTGSGTNPPRTMPLAPINNQGTGSPYPVDQRTDLGAISSNGGNPSGQYFIANITLSTSASTAPGTYTISNTTGATPGVGGRISITNDSSGATTFAISQSTFSFTVIPEPSTYALLALGGIALGTMAYRRRALS